MTVSKCISGALSASVQFADAVVEVAVAAVISNLSNDAAADPEEMGHLESDTIIIKSGLGVLFIEDVRP